MNNSLLQFNAWAKSLSLYNDVTISSIKTDIENALEKKYNAIAYGSHVYDTAINRLRPLDIYVLCKEDFYFSATDNFDTRKFNLTEKNIYFLDYKEDVFKKIILYFGKHNVVLKSDTTIRIKLKDKIINITPTYEHRYYDGEINGKATYIEGLCFFDKDRNMIINYPSYEYKNFIEKNKAAEYHYASMVRVMKNIALWLTNKESRFIPVHSYLITSLVWNTPNNILKNSNIEDACVDVIAYLYEMFINGKYKDMFEINDIKLLFSIKQKWDYENAINFIYQCRKYIV